MKFQLIDTKIMKNIFLNNQNINNNIGGVLL